MKSEVEVDMLIREPKESARILNFTPEAEKALNEMGEGRLTEKELQYAVGVMVADGLCKEETNDEGRVTTAELGVDEFEFIRDFIFTDRKKRAEGLVEQGFYLLKQIGTWVTPSSYQRACKKIEQANYLTNSVKDGNYRSVTKCLLGLRNVITFEVSRIRIESLLARRGNDKHHEDVMSKIANAEAVMVSAADRGVVMIKKAESDIIKEYNKLPVVGKKADVPLFEIRFEIKPKPVPKPVEVPRLDLPPADKAPAAKPALAKSDKPAADTTKAKKTVVRTSHKPKVVDKKKVVLPMRSSAIVVKFCPDCGTERIKSTAKFCITCGEPFPGPKKAPTLKKPAAKKPKKTEVKPSKAKTPVKASKESKPEFKIVRRQTSNVATPLGVVPKALAKAVKKEAKQTEWKPIGKGQGFENLGEILKNGN